MFGSMLPLLPRVSARLAIAALGCAAPVGFAQSTDAAAGFPNRAIRLIVPSTPGGTTDLLARVLQPRLAETLGQAVVVDNKPGAGTTLGTQLVAQAAADGYTLGLVYTPHSSNPGLVAKLPYDTLRDFAPVAMLTAAPLVLVVPPQSPAKNLNELIALAKSKSLSYGSSGIGSGGHLSGELMKRLAKIDALHIPYKGAGPAAADVVNGVLDFQFASQITIRGFLPQGRLRALAVTSVQRAASLPDIPSMSEAGLAGFEFLNWFGVVAPSKTPAPVIARLNRDINLALAHPEVRTKLTGEGSEIVGGTPAAFDAFLKKDIARWTEVVRAAGIKAE